MGLALFLRRGMPDWVAAWSHCLPATALPPPKPQATQPSLLPDALQAQVVLLLAEMALYGRRQEVQL